MRSLLLPTRSVTGAASWSNPSGSTPQSSLAASYGELFGDQWLHPSGSTRGGACYEMDGGVGPKGGRTRWLQLKECLLVLQPLATRGEALCEQLIDNVKALGHAPVAVNSMDPMASSSSRGHDDHQVVLKTWDLAATRRQQPKQTTTPQAGWILGRTVAPSRLLLRGCVLPAALSTTSPRHKN
ncbi:hypothetical protein U9M48_025564 [Paspalum notatum var. saurae]|uniref:Uncharacterized protein n=1 Tax=Paspalum notatum var. saurae TaxID=547442 RepID=A0AAQ3TTH9_PASNO